MFVSYLVAYYLVPKYFNHQKHVAFTISIILAMFLLISYSMIRNYLEFPPQVKAAIGLSGGLSFFNNFRPGIIRVFGNPPLICGLFLSLKNLKNWHLEQLKTETLAKENTNAELQLLKAQIHHIFYSIP
jgi:hypothetical protein